MGGGGIKDDIITWSCIVMSTSQAEGDRRAIKTGSLDAWE